MKTMLVYAGLTILLGSLGLWAGGRLRGVLHDRRMLSAWVAFMALLALGCHFASLLLVMPTSSVTLLAYGTHGVFSTGNVIRVSGSGTEALEQGSLYPVTEGSWQTDDEGLTVLWPENAEGELPQRLTIQVPVGVRRWIRFAQGQDGGEVIVNDGDFTVSVDTFGFEREEKKVFLPDSSSSLLAAQKKQRLAVFALLLAGMTALAALGLRYAHGHAERRDSADGMAFLQLMFIVGAVVHGLTGAAARKGALGLDLVMMLCGSLLLRSMERSGRSGMDRVRSTALMGIRAIMPVWCIRWLAGAIGCAAAGGVWQLGKSLPSLAPLQALGVLTRETVMDETAWLMSAVLLASVLISLLIAVDEKGYFTMIAPITVVIAAGYFFRFFGGFDVSAQPGPMGFLTAGLLRAFADMSLGCLLWRAASGVRGLREKRPLLRAWSSVWELALILLTQWMMWSWRTAELDLLPYTLMALLVLSVCGCESYLMQAMGHPAAVWLGKAALPLYAFYLLVGQSVKQWLPGMDVSRGAQLSLAVAMAAAVVFCLMASGIRKLCGSSARRGG